MPRANRRYLPGHVWHITHRAAHLQIAEMEGTYTLREPGTLYPHDFEGKNDLPCFLLPAESVPAVCRSS